MVGMRRQAGKANRQDGANTRSALLEAAGIVFAEMGFDRTTAKEIAQRAQTNAAAVNYHFKGIEALYEEVLVEAHRRILNYDDLVKASSGDDAPKVKLRNLISLVVRIVRADTKESWPTKVLVREVISPTSYFGRLRREELEPKRQLVTAMVAAILEVPPEHALVGQAMISVLAPCFMLLVARERITEIIPSLGPEQLDSEALIDRLVAFSLGGLASIAALARPQNGA